MRAEASRYQQALLPIVLGVTFMASSIAILGRGHVYEDAYILLQYSRNVANGLGIVFDRMSGPSEGATDFLWMIVLSGFAKIGADIATTAAILNGLGLAIITYVIIVVRGRVDLTSAVLAALVVVSGGTSASLGGFSALSYGAVFSLLVLAALREHYRVLVMLGLCIALMRPDGVILALGTISATLITAAPPARKSILVMIAGAAVLGLTYFVWRYTYFGLPLPLPLMVKSKPDSVFDGLRGNAVAIGRYIPLLLLCLWIVRKSDRSFAWKEAAKVLLGPTLLFIALCFAHQSQNVGYRFQFPIIVGFLIFVAHLLSRVQLLSRSLRVWLPLLALPAVVYSARMLRHDVGFLLNDDYIYSFPQHLRREGFEARNIALTEAGRFPYWFNTDRMTDLVGLNSAAVASKGVAATLESTRPELLFVNQDGRFQVNQMNDAQDFVSVDLEEIRAQAYTGSNPVALAPLAALAYARANDFEAIFVRGARGGFGHVYFLSRDLDKDRFLSALKKSFAHKLSYYDSVAYLDEDNPRDANSTTVP